jgi:transcriptional regulator with XRE-family HTH domain
MGRPAQDRQAKRAALSNELVKRARTKEAWAPFAEALTQYLAQRLRVLRLHQGKTQMEMAALCGLSFQQYGKYECGESGLPPDKMWLIATCFGIDITYFFDGFDLGMAVDRNVATAARGDHMRGRKLEPLLKLIRAFVDESSK